MTSDVFVKKIKNYAVVSFLLPLLAINSCLLVYKYFGNLNDHVSMYANFDWNEDERIYTLEEYNLIYYDPESYTFTNCPKYQYLKSWNTIDNEVIPSIDGNYDLIDNLRNDNKIKSVTFKNKNNLNSRCIKNHPSYALIKKFTWLEKILIKGVTNNPAGFVKNRNPYLYGEVSISRTARYYPTVFIFKPLMILSSLFLFLYWRNNLNLFNTLKSENILGNFSRKFFYFGIFSCLLLILHATFLGIDLDSKLFKLMRRIIIILFILFEVTAQILLTKNLFVLREGLKKYINPLILKIKIIFVVLVFLITLAAFLFLIFGNPSTSFKHILEWNYFSALLCYYLLSRLLWK